MLMALANVALGIYIYCAMYGGNFSVWAGLCATGLGLVCLLQHALDIQEKHAVLREARKALQAAGPADGDSEYDGNGIDPSTPHKQHDMGSAAGADSMYGSGAFAADAAPAAAADVAPGPKLTPSLLQHHNVAASRGFVGDVGLVHPPQVVPGVVSYGMPQAAVPVYEDIRHASWDQGANHYMAPPQPGQQG